MAEKILKNLFSETGAINASPLDANDKKLNNLYADSYTALKNKGGIGGGTVYLGASLAAGIGGIGEGAYDLVVGMSSIIGGNKAYAKNLFGTNAVGEWHKNIEDGFNPNKAMKFTGDVTTGLGQSAIMLIPAAGVPLFFGGVMGQGVGSAVEQTGELGFKEVAYGITTGAIEGTLEWALGAGGQALSKVTKGATKTISGKIASSIAKEWAASAVWKGVAKDVVSEAMGEFMEEALSEIIDPVLQRGFKINEDASTTMRQVLYAGLVGMVSGAVMGGAVTGVSTTAAYNAGKRTVANGNAEATVREARKIADGLKIDKDSKVSDADLKQLVEAIDTYEKVAAQDATSAATMIQLGELQGYMTRIQMKAAVLVESARLSTVSERAAESYAQYMSDNDTKAGKSAKKYTAQDWYADKDDIRTRYAAMGWAGAFLGDTETMRESVAFDEVVKADLERREVGETTVSNIEDANWDGESGTYYTDAPGNEGNYIRVIKLKDGTYSIGRGNSSSELRGYRGLTQEQAQAEFERIKGATIANREKIEQAQNLEAQARAAQAEADRLHAPDSFATKSQRRAADKAAKLATDAAQAADTQLEDITPAGSSELAENPYDQATMNMARRAVRGFDNLTADTKARILRWIESSKDAGLSFDVVSGIANIIRIRGDLQVTLAGTRENVGGLHRKAAAPGRNLIVLGDGKGTEILLETIAHEVGHEVESAEGFDELKEAALKATNDADKKRWEELYKKDNPKATQTEVDIEVAMKTLGRRLATPRFVERYANKSMLGHLIDSCKQMIAVFRADEAGKLEIKTAEKLMSMLDEAIIKGEVSQKAEVGESETKYNIAGQKLVDFINSVNSMQNKKQISKRRHEIGKISASHAKLINDLLGEIGIQMDATGYSIWIDGTHAKHIEDRHGKKGEADQSMATDENKSKIPWAIDTADYGEIIRDENGNVKYSNVYDNADQTPAPQIRLIKKVGDDTLYVSECVPDSKTKKIFITSAYMQKGSNVQLLNIDANASPQPTPKAVTGSNATNNSIPQSGEKSTPSSKNPHNLVEQTQKEVFDEVFEPSEDGGDIPDNRVLRSTTRYSILEAPQLAEKTEARNAKDGNVAPRTLKQGLETMKQMAALMKPYLSKEGILPPDVIGKTAWKNGSYGRTMENTTLCVRTLTYEYFKDEVAKAIGRPLTVAESLLASQKIYDIATYPQCIYCYVAADRKSYDAFIGEYMAAMDKYIKLLREGGDSDQLFQEYLRGRDPTNAQKTRWAEWKRIAKSGEDYIKASDVNTRSRRNALINKGGKVAAQVRDAQRYAQSASWAKSVSDYVAYGGDILKFSQKMVDSLNNEYGLRMYSFSDYTPAFIVENMQMVLDASVRGLKVLSYTKDADYVRIFGDSGMAINMSCFARYDSKTGTYVEDSRQGMKWDEVKQLRSEHKTAGAVMVVTDDNMLNWALDQDWIDVVIPYHIVKTGTTIAGEYSWRNYTRESADYAGNKTANIYPTEHNNDFEQFRKLVEERGITPRFNEWYVKAVNGEISGDKYMKLVNEVRVPAAQLSAVEPKFDLDAALDSFGIDAEGNAITGGYVDKGGYMGNWFKAGVDVMQEVRVVAEDISAGRTVSDVKYGRQSIREAGGVPKIRYNLTEDAAEQAARDAAEVEEFLNAEEALSARAEQTGIEEEAMSKAERAVFEAELSRSEVNAKDGGSRWFAWADVQRSVNDMVKDYGIKGSSAQYVAFAVHRAFNGFNAVTNYKERRENMINGLVDYIIEVADAAEGSAGRWKDERRAQLRAKLDEAYGALGKETRRQKAKERIENAEERARAAVNGTAIATLLDRVRMRRFRTKTSGKITPEAFKNLESLARSIRPKYQINLQNAEQFLVEFTEFAKTYAKEAMNYAQDPASETYRQAFNDAKGSNPILNYIDKRMATLLIEFGERESGSEWTEGDYEVLKVALERLLAMDSRFDKQYNTDGTFGETSEVAEGVMKSLHKKYGGKVSAVNVGGVRSIFQTLIYNSLEPEAAVRLIENAAGKHVLSRMINAIKFEAEYAKVEERKWLKELEDFKKKNKKWWKEWNEGDVVFEYTLPTMDGKSKTLSVVLTKDEAASFYMTSKRHQARAALALGRVEIADAQGRKGEQYRSRLIDGLTEAQLDELKAMDASGREGFVLKCENAMDVAMRDLYKKFSAEDKQYIALIEQFYATTSKKEKRDMDTRLFGSTNVFDGYYYPISRSSFNRDMDLSASYHDLDDVSTRGYTFNKSTIEGAKSRLTIRGATEVTSRHARQLAMYKHLSMPLQNLQRVYNYRSDATTAGTATIRDYVDKYVWKGFEKYLSDYYKDVQGMSRRTADDAASQLFRHLQSGYVKFQLGANLKSMIKQFGSAFNMLAVADFDVWYKGLNPEVVFSKGALADMLKYSDFAATRLDSNEVYYAAGAAGTVGKISDAMMKHLEWGDAGANLIMWSMAQYAVQKRDGLAIGTEENKQLAGKELDKFIVSVQDTSGAATKSAYARSPQVLVQGFTLFTSAPTKMFSKLYVATSEYFELRRMKRDGKVGKGEQERIDKLEKNAKTAIGKAGAAIVGAALFESLINLAWGALRGKDDEEEEQKFISKLAVEVGSNIVGIVPLAGTAAESLISGYDVSNLYLDMYNDGLAALRNTYTITADLAAGKQVSQQTILKNLRSVAYFGGQMTGIPLRNINTVIIMSLNTVSPAAAYEYDKLFYEPAYSADLAKAIADGNDKLADSIVNLSLKERTGAASSYAADEVVRLAMAGYTVMPRDIPSTADVGGEEVKLTRKQRESFRELYSAADSAVIAVIATEQYAEISDELRAKAVKIAYEIYHSRAKTEVLGSELSVMAALSYFDEYIDVATLVAESAYIYGIKATSDATRAQIVRSYISGYSTEAQAILLYAAGYRSEAVKEIMASLASGLPDDIRERVQDKLVS